MVKTVCGCEYGLSDHSLTTAIPVAAAVLGASVIEKHLTISRADGGPDAAFSLEPAEFGAMVRDVRDAVAALGEVTFGPTASEASSLPFRRKSGGKRGA
jgi:sialic acid synthase SpsE